MARFYRCSFMLLLASKVVATPVLPNILSVSQPDLTLLTHDVNNNISAAAAILSSLSSPPTTLLFNLKGIPIQPQAMSSTILRMQLKLRRYIATHYDSANDVLFYSDDPYMSDSELTGCFFAATHWPPDRQKHLTYGMVNNALTGVWDFMFRGGRFVSADFFIVDERLGMVGVGRVMKDPLFPGLGNIKEGEEV